MLSGHLLSLRCTKAGFQWRAEVHVKGWDKRSSSRPLYNIAVALLLVQMGGGVEWFLSDRTSINTSVEGCGHQPRCNAANQGERGDDKNNTFITVFTSSDIRPGVTCQASLFTTTLLQWKKEALVQRKWIMDGVKVRLHNPINVCCIVLTSTYRVTANACLLILW